MPSRRATMPSNTSERNARKTTPAKTRPDTPPRSSRTSAGAQHARNATNPAGILFMHCTAAQRLSAERPAPDEARFTHPLVPGRSSRLLASRWRPDRLDDDRSIQLHPFTRTVAPNVLSGDCIVLCDEVRSMLPGQEAAPVHAGIRVSPQRVRLIGNEVRRSHEVLTGCEDRAAQRATRLPENDESHPRSFACLANVEDQPPADGTPTFRHERSTPPVGWILLLGGDVVQTGYIGNTSDREHG